MSMYNLFLSLSQILFFTLLIMGLASLKYSVMLFIEGKLLFLEWEVMEYSSNQIFMSFIVDWVSLSFGGVVLLISSMVMYYSSSYMGSDKTLARFLLLVLLFVISMLLLIFSPNMISILLGWDGLGLVSYCLVIYYQNVKSANAGLLTVLSNRVGDVFILLSISWLFNYGGWNFYYLPFMYSQWSLFLIVVLVMLAAMTKSAQIPFSAWLPAAMAAPTPVSSLVHSSTLVTAGVYLLIRFSESLQLNNFLLFISVLTMFMSGLGANFEMDLKKIIALSTLSQLGVMMFILSLGFMELAYFHLITHALFKSLLFLCAGAYIHSVGDIQDIRMIGGVSKILPITSLFFMGCSLSLCGFPFLAGFYSKDLIIESFFMTSMNFLIKVLVILGTMMTATYSLRLVYFIYYKNMFVNLQMVVKEDYSMVGPMAVLFVVSIFIGCLFNWLFLPNLVILLPGVMKSLIMLMLLYFSLLMWGLLKLNFILAGLSSYLYSFMGGMWFLPGVSSVLFMPWLKSGLLYLKFLDNGWLEYYGGQGIHTNLSKFYNFSNYFNNLGLKSYLVMAFFILFLMGSFF